MATSKIKKTGEIIKLISFRWQHTAAASAGAKLLDASPQNSLNPADIPTGYTFKAWVYTASVNWVGAIYMSAPLAQQSGVWTPTAKPTTGGDWSISAVALYVRNDSA